MKTSDSVTLEVWYLSAWGALHILVGVLFSVIFVLGAIVLKDWTKLLYLVLSVGLIFTGITRIRKPYLICTQATITVIGMFGGTSFAYRWTDPKKLVIKGNRFYLGDQKLKFNNWFTNRNQYQNMIRFYTGSATLSQELQD